MDGLLIDTEPHWQRVEVEVLGDIGIPLTKELLDATTGMTMRETITYYTTPYPDVKFNADDMMERIHNKMVEVIQKDGQAMPGALATIEICAAAGLKLAIASSSHPVVIETVITRLDLNSIKTYCSAVNELRGKPAPDVFLTAARKLGLKPSECLVFEDSVAGVKAAKQAGMTCIAVPDPEMFDDPRFNIADLKLHSLKDFNKKILQTFI